MTLPMQDDDSVDKAAEAIQMRAQTAYYLISSDGELTVEARQARLAKVYVAAFDDMQKLVASTTGANEARRQQLVQKVFGTAGLPGDPASLAMSARDAAERVAQIDVADAYSASQLLQRADMLGDEVLARAVAAAAYTNPLGGWSSVLDEFLEDRPAAAQALAELSQLDQANAALTSFGYNWQFQVQKPAELSGVDDWKLRAMAAGAPQ